MLARSAALVSLAFFALNLAMLAAVHSYGLWRPPIDVQSRTAYQARVAAFFNEPATARAVFLGDSLVFGSQLKTEHGNTWPERTLSARFAARAKSAGKGRYAALNLGINGVLFSELDCVASEVLAHKPELLFINLSARPFSADFRVPTKESERAFLCPARAGLRERAHDTLATQVMLGLPVLRFREIAQVALLGNTPREHLLSSSDAWLAKLPSAAKRSDDESDEDDAELAEVMREMAWRTKAAARYNTISVSTSHPQAAELARLLRRLSAQKETEVVLFYLRENLTPLEGQLDLPHYRVETAKFEALVRSQLRGSAVHFVVVPSEPLADHYVDHIHLDAQGYDMLAQTLLSATSAPPDALP